MTPQERQLTELFEPAIDATGFELVRLRMTGSRMKTLQIMAERPDGTMTAEDCATLSRAISRLIDEVDPISDKFVLEVSSPGIDRPLTRLKDFDRWQGFPVKIELTQLVENQKRFRGVLAGIEGEDVLIDLDGEEETAMIPFALISIAKLVLTDELITESLRRSKAAEKAQTTDTPDDDLATD